MTDFSSLITDGQNNTDVKCKFCDASILAPKSASILKEAQELPTVTQKKDAPSLTTENVSF